ncbi:class F sortase [Streptomyces mobaraensis]|uniref:class F sortase n=1 Tax=Streptomyces mobaraensis TaxID=35621 RepID=UPI003327EE00
MPGRTGRAALCLTGALALALVPGILPSGSVPGTGRPARHQPAPREVYTSPPVAVEVPGHLHASVVPVAADADGALELPRPPDTVGWWSLGARPGAREGTVLLAGHVDTREYGLGAFAALRDIPLGTRATLTSADGRSHPYLITGRRSYPKSALPAKWFTDTGHARLALVTCAGEYDRRHHRYTENLALLAEPLPADP